MDLAHRAALRAELLARADADQAARHALPPRPGAKDWQHVRDLDAANSQWLLATVSRYGWPGHAMANTDAAHAAWLLAQHSPSDMQEFFLPLMVEAVKAGDADPADAAYLIDRVRVRQLRGQLYGTQYELTGDDLRLSPVENPDHLDQRRASVGLGPHADYDANTRQAHDANGS